MKGYKINMAVSIGICVIGISIAVAQVGIIHDFDPKGGGIVMVASTEASSHLPAHKGKKYESDCGADTRYETAWCEGVKGDGRGEWIQFNLHEWELYGEIINVYRVLIVNGFAASRGLYYANNRVKKVQLEFSEGQRRTIELKDGVLDFQVFVVHTKTKWVRMRILEVYKGKKYEDTCISEVSFETIDHPCDLTEEQRERLLESGWDVDPNKWGCEEVKSDKKKGKK